MGEAQAAVRSALAAVAVLALGALWYWTPLREWLVPQQIVAVTGSLRDGAVGPVLWAAIFTLAGMLMVPLTVLVVATALLFGPMVGVVISMGAGVASAVGGYLLGRWVWRDTVRRLAGPRLDRISRVVGAKGILSMVAVRLVPIAPFTVVNMVAGASHVELRDFALGSALGMAPGIIVFSVLSDSAVAAVADPQPSSFAVLVTLAMFFGVALVWLRRHFGAIEDKPAE